MTSRDLSKARVIAIGVLVLPLLVTGCKKKAAPPPPPPPPPRGPAMISPGIVAESMMLSASVVVGSLPDTECTEEEVRAMLQFADDFATGNTEALRGKMQGSARNVLDDLVETGAWGQVNSELQSVVLTRIDKTMSQSVFAFDVVTRSGERDPLGWVLTQRGDTFTFKTYFVPPPIEVPEIATEIETESEDDSSAIHSSKPPPNRSPDPRRRVPKSPGGPGPGPG